MGWIVRLNGKGRIVIPGEVREKLGLRKGDSLVLDINDNVIMLMALEGKKPSTSGRDDLKDFLSDE